MKSINPNTLETIGKYKEMPWNDVENLLNISHKSWLEWRETSFEARSYLFNKAANIIRNNKDKYAKLITDEMGKISKEAFSEIEKCAWACEYYAENGAEFLKDEIIKTDSSKSFLTYQPTGTVLAVMPWNFPFWQVLRAAIPTIMSGNNMVLKHASNVCGCALAIEEIFTLAGFPKGVFQTLLIPAEDVKKVIAHDTISAVTLTGSVNAGKAVAKAAGENLKKTVLELGGSDPYVILKDADIEKSAEICTASRILNCGQTCVSAKRFIVVEEIYDEFLSAFTTTMSNIKYGNPYDESSNIGPLSTEGLRNDLHQQVVDSIEKGAKCIIGGEIPKEKGFFYPPTILTDVKPGTPAYDEELFGPVASVIKVKDENEAIRVANDTIYGLGAAVFTKDIKRGEEIARTKIQSGLCFVNSMVRSDPRLPFGGIKQSGYGRELSLFGIRAFMNVKSVSIP